MTTDTTDTVFIGAKGGVGTSTVAALYAISAARSGQPVRLTATAAVGVDDLASILGIPAPAPDEVVEAAPGLSVADHRSCDSANVIDAGTDCFSDHGDRVFLVVRNDYNCLRRALGAPWTALGVILVNEPKRALGRRDVEDVLARPIVAELHMEDRIARATDAGILVRVRPPLDLARLAETTAAQ